jgi:hypothetical protein
MNMKSLAFFLPALLLVLLNSFAQEEEQKTSDWEDSPFGFHPATAPGEHPYEYAQDIGVRWDRSGLYFMWVLVQPDLGKKDYDWSRYDHLMEDVPEGMWLLRNITAAHVQMIAGGGPGGRGREVDISRHIKGRSYLPGDEEAYMDFVTACVERYDGDGKDDMPGLRTPVKYWQVCNEPPHGLPGYPRLVEITCKAIKKADKDAKVLIGGATGFPDRYVEIFEREYLPLLKELNGKYVDIFDFHWYGNATGDYRFDEAFEAIKKGLRDSGFKDIPIWITEMGSYSGEPRGRMGERLPYQTEEQQAADLLKRHVYSFAEGIQKVFWAWGLVEGFKNDDGYFDHTGLVYDGRMSGDEGRGVKKKAYHTYKLMTEKLEGSDWANIETIIDGKDEVFAFKFTRKKTGRAIIVAWWDYFAEEGYKDGDKKEISLKLPDGEYRITSAITTADGEERFVNKSAQNGRLTGKLGEEPVFIEMNR